MSEITLDEERKRTNPIQSSNNAATMKKQDTNDTFAKLDFPAGMTYGHRSSLRKVCSRFLRFAYLVDFLSMEALSNIYKNSITEMLTRLEELDYHGTENLSKVMVMEFDDANGAGQAQRGYEPLFYINLVLETTGVIEASDEVLVPINDFILPPRGTSIEEDFDIFAHLELEEEKADEGAEVEDGAEPEAQAPNQKYKRTMPDIHNRWTEFKPNEDDFIGRINQDFDLGLDEISDCFKRWSKHEEMKKYADALEEWDDIVGETWESPEEETLSPVTWINDTEIYLQRKSRVVGLVQSAYTKTKQYLARFQPILEIYWRNTMFDPNALKDERLKNTVETIGNVMKLFKYHQSHFQSNLPACTDIGMLQIDSKEIKTKLQPTPKNINDSIETLLPAENKVRIEQSRLWLAQSFKDLSQNVTNVAEFVVQTKFLANIQEKFQGYRDKVDLYSQIYQVVEANGLLKVKKEDEQNLKDTKKLIQELNQIVQSVEQSMETANEKFKKQLEQLIPQLNNQVGQLNTESTDPKYLDEKQPMEDIIKELDEKWEVFKKLEETSIKYNSW